MSAGQELAAPDVQQLGPAVLLRGQAVRDALALVVRGISAAHRSDGISPPPRLLNLAAALGAAAAMSVQRRDDVATEGYKENLCQTEDRIDSGKAAAILGVGVRQVQRIARSIGGRRVGRVWSFNSIDVQQYANGKQE